MVVSWLVHTVIDLQAGLLLEVLVEEGDWEHQPWVAMREGEQGVSEPSLSLISARLCCV
jgi:hypothetical protein